MPDTPKRTMESYTKLLWRHLLRAHTHSVNLKRFNFFSDYGHYNFPHCGRDGYVSTVVFALRAHFKKVSRYNQTMFGDHTYGTVPVDYLRFVHVDRDGYAIKALGPRRPHPYLNPDSSPPIDVLLQ